MKLHYTLHNSLTKNKLPILLIHGLFGNLDNLGVLARALMIKNSIIQVDLRNHGHSPHANTMTYAAMANDLLTLLNELSIPKVTVVGHSMGGKVAMALTQIAPERISQLIILDIAPVPYTADKHNAIFAALHTVVDAKVQTRRDAHTIMRTLLQDEITIQFLLKSFQQGQWKFNLPILSQQYPNLCDWHDVPPWPLPTLFIKGEYSDYIQTKDKGAIVRQFPVAKVHQISGCSHWLHAEKPSRVIQVISHFIKE